MQHKWILFLLVFGSAALFAQEPAWESLFNGKNLSGWEQLGGAAEYRVEDGVIIGVAALNTPNSFLCTRQNYADFILEISFKVDAPLNSGIQIRSNSMADYLGGRVHGYQVEIDPSARAYSGGIYDEGRRGWIYPLAENAAGRTAFKSGEWNQFRIEAIGNDIRTWLNGVQCANLVDDLTASGFIGLQVHGIGDNREMVGKTVRWKNIRMLTKDLAKHRYLSEPNAIETNYVANTSTAYESRRGWRLLWDGKTTTGWRGARLTHFPEKGWEIEDGALIVKAPGGGDIVTMEKFANFELKLEFKISEGANSGIKYFVDTELKEGEGASIGLEYQILDDQKHDDAKSGVGGNRTLASLYDLIPAKNLSVPGRWKDFRGIGQWNQARIVAKGNHVEHWLNGFKVVEYERGTQIFRALVAKSKYSAWPNFGELPQGHILLQDHGDEVAFRSIKIREF